MVSGTRKAPRRLGKLLADFRPTPHELQAFEAHLAMVGADEDHHDEEVGDRDLRDEFGEFQQEYRAKRTAPKEIRPEALDEAEAARAWAASLADGVKANSEEDVVRWRRQWLGGQTVVWEEVESTLGELPGDDQPDDVWVADIGRRVVVVGHVDEDEDVMDRSVRVALGQPLKDLPGYGDTVQVPLVHPSGERSEVRATRTLALIELQQISEGLARRWWWDVDQAVVFILTGLPPWASTLKVQQVSPLFQRQGGTRIVLTIDPAVPLDHVIRAYSEARKPYVRAGRPVEAATWEAVAWRLEHLDLSATAAARAWLRKRGVSEPSQDEIKAWKRKVKAALDRLDFDNEET